MSVAGIDVGDQATCVAVARKRGVDVLLNRESKRESPTLVSFGPKQRLLGTDAVGAQTVNPRNTVSGIKRLLGKKFAAPEVQADLPRLPFSVIEGPDGGCAVKVSYLGEERVFTPEQLLAAVIVDQKAVAAADGSPITDCVLTVPTYFAEPERAAVLAAAQIAGVNCLRLLNETTATALAYGIYKTDLPADAPVNVAFVDAGANSLQASKGWGGLGEGREGVQPRGAQACCPADHPNHPPNPRPPTAHPTLPAGFDCGFQKRAAARAGPRLGPGPGWPRI